MAHSMKHLEVKDRYAEDVMIDYQDGLKNLFELQRLIQEKVYKYDFKEMQKNMRSVEKFCTMNYHAVQDELREFFAALGGVNSGGNAIWKPWKKDFAKYQNMPLDMLSEEEINEIKFELIDAQHFIFNLMLSVGMTAEELYNMYYAKNAENIKRQQDGY